LSKNWKNLLYYLGFENGDGHIEHFEDEEETREEMPNVRKLRRSEMGKPIIQPVPSPIGKVHVIDPKNFNDAQIIAEKFKANIPVIMNLQQVDKELSKRLVDFTSGLTYALDGAMKKIADKVFLLTPSNVEVSAEERRRLQERGIFFNQF
jgi:cell division inhibitor SepF